MSITNIREIHKMNGHAQRRVLPPSDIPPLQTSMGWLHLKSFEVLKRGLCPACGSAKGMYPGRKAPVSDPVGDGPVKKHVPMTQEMVCRNCLMEFDAGPAGAKVVNKHCPGSRLLEVYGITAEMLEAQS